MASALRTCFCHPKFQLQNPIDHCNLGKAFENKNLRSFLGGSLGLRRIQSLLGFCHGLGCVPTSFHLRGNVLQIREGYHIPAGLLITLEEGGDVAASFQPFLEKVTLLLDQVASTLGQLVQFGLTGRVDQLGNAALHGPDNCQCLGDQLGNLSVGFLSVPRCSFCSCFLCSCRGLGSLVWNLENRKDGNQLQ